MYNNVGLADFSKAVRPQIFKASFALLCLRPGLLFTFFLGMTTVT